MISVRTLHLLLYTRLLILLLLHCCMVYRELLVVTQ